MWTVLEVCRGMWGVKVYATDLLKLTSSKMDPDFVPQSALELISIAKTTLDTVTVPKQTKNESLTLFPGNPLPIPKITPPILMNTSPCFYSSFKTPQAKKTPACCSSLEHTHPHSPQVCTVLYWTTLGFHLLDLFMNFLIQSQERFPGFEQGDLPRLTVLQQFYYN